MTKRIFDTAAIDRSDRSKLLLGLVVPRPIGWIGSTGPTGDNLAPFSFYNLVATTPPTVLFCPGMSVRTKDTLLNVAATREFTVNVVTSDMADAMNATSGEYGPDVDEFALAGVTKAVGEIVTAPLVAEAKANFECRVTAIHEIGDGPSASVVYGEVLRIHAHERILVGTRIDFERLGAVGRLAGGWYSRVTDLFEMERPTDG